MATWSSLVLLSVLAVSTLSLPQPDERAYRIPSVGTGRRAQYFVQHSDGTYKYGHDTGEGAFESARLKTSGDLDGEFGYKDPEGEDVRVQYKSGTGGFQARGDHLPVPHPDFTAAHSEARARAPFVDPLADSNTDASYNFKFAGDEHSRTEVADADGNVRGSYTYIDEEGRTRTVTYTAGRDTGFVVESDDLPQAIETDATPAATRLTGSTRRFSASRPVGTTSSQRLSGSSKFRGSTGTQSVSGRPSTSSSSSSHFGSRLSSTSSAGQTYRAPSRTSINIGSSATRGSSSFHSGSRTPSTFTSTASQTPSTFGSSATRGSSSTFGSSTTRGSSSTFGSSATRGSSSTFGSSATRGSSAFGSSVRGASTFGSSASRSPSTYTASSTTSTSSALRRPSTSFRPTSSTAQTRLGSRPFEEANTRSEVRPDGGYSFAYETSSHSRAESGDRDNNVDGRFDFVAEDDGQQRAIEYEAGSDTGFIAEGAHIPVGPEVPGAPSGQPTGRIVPVKEVVFVDPLANTGLDASYNFAFDGDEYSRTETADDEGNVQGTYSVVDEDGTRRTYRFRAGKGIGFETEEISVSRGPVPARVASGGRTSSSTFSSTSGSTFSTSGSSSHRAAAGSHGSASTTGGVVSYQAGSSATRGSGARRPSTTSTFTSSSSTSPSRANPLSSPFKPSSSQEVFPGFTLHQYDFTKNPEKFGYVLNFD